MMFVTTVLVLSLLGVTWYHVDPATAASMPSITTALYGMTGSGGEHASSPFRGAFARFPYVSRLPPRERRLTIVMVWNGDNLDQRMRHLLYGAQQNADTIDVLLVNRVLADAPTRNCIDFAGAGIDLTWGGNVKVVCMQDEEWQRRHVDFLCSSRYGWDCNELQRREVAVELAKRKNEFNYNWRPLLGWIFRDLFDAPENPFWAWMDTDCVMGDFRHFPFNILSRVSLLSGVPYEAHAPMLAGQITAFNMDDPDIASAWKLIPQMRTPEHFTKFIDGWMPESAEEIYWSAQYLNPNVSAGARVSYAMLPDLNGDDFYDGKWYVSNAGQVYLVSGRDVLLVPSSLTRKQMEDTLAIQRHEEPDDMGGVGWTGGEDGSEYLFEDPELHHLAAKRKAVEAARAKHAQARAHTGVVDSPQILETTKRRGRVIVSPLLPENYTWPRPKASLVRFKDQPGNYVLRRLELDTGAKGYERKLLRHSLALKKQDWFKLPDFDITPNHILLMNLDGMVAFEMGANRDKDLFRADPPRDAQQT